MVIKFGYTNAQGIKTNKKVLLLKESATHIMAVDLKGMQPRKVKKLFKNHVVTELTFGKRTPSTSPKKPRTRLEKLVSTKIRVFKKENME